MLFASLLAPALVAWSVGPATQPAWKAHVDPAGQVYPSMVLAMATAKPASEAPTEKSEKQAEVDEKVASQTLGDPEGWIYVTLTSPADQTPIKVTITCDDIMEPSTYKGVLAKKGEFYGVAPKIRWKYKDLAKVRQPIPANVVFSVKVGEAEAEEDVRVVTLHTVNDCPYLHVEIDEEKDEATVRNLAFMFAAYVNEDHPWIDALLREALATRIVENFTGYQLGKEDEVFKQVYAVWNVLQQRGITYSDITRTTVREATVPSQHVRFLDESIEMKQANCVDGSVLIASILRKIGIDVFLFITPNHCYVGFFTNKDRTNMVGLETTVLGTAKKEEFERTKHLRALIDDTRTFDEMSYQSFEAALAEGSKNLAEHTGKMLDGEFQYVQVLIKEAREQGIRAIPYFPPEKATALPGKPAELDETEQIRRDIRELQIGR
jgi:hypothetical protein